MPCTKATEELLNAIPAIDAPSIISVRAGTFEPSAHACRSEPESIATAFRDSASVIGCARLEMYASIACVNASTPTAAVRCGGVVSESNASTIATRARRHGLLSIILTFRSVSVITVTLETSLPVPPVVGMAINGALGFGILSTPM